MRLDGVHVVRRGDTLWDISRRYGVTVKDLQRWNHRVRVIHPGQRIVVYPGASRHVRHRKRR